MGSAFCYQYKFLHIRCNGCAVASCSPASCVLVATFIQQRLRTWGTVRPEIGTGTHQERARGRDDEWCCVHFALQADVHPHEDMYVVQDTLFVIIPDFSFLLLYIHFPYHLMYVSVTLLVYVFFSSLLSYSLSGISHPPVDLRSFYISFLFFLSPLLLNKWSISFDIKFLVDINCRNTFSLYSTKFSISSINNGVESFGVSSSLFFFYKNELGGESFQFYTEE